MLARSILAWSFVALYHSCLGEAKLVTAAFSNQRRLLFDTDGQQVDAYGSKINFFNNTYYLYGNSFSKTGSADGIKSYSSNDLIEWQAHGYIYDINTANPCTEIGGCGRPHIIYNARSSKYILWANAGSSGYIVATSSSPTGPFEFESTPASIDPRFNGLQPADFAVEVLGDKAYLVFSALNFRYPAAGSIWPPIQQTLHISPLTPNYLNTTGVSYNVTSAASDLIDQEAESPDLFFANGQYYVVASNTCGYCNGSIALVYRSASIKGPWTRQIIAGDGCQSQVEGVATLATGSGKPVLLWHGTSVPGGPRVGFSGHVFQPLNIGSGGQVAQLDCSPQRTFTVSFQQGSAPQPTGLALSATDASPADAVYTSVCDSDQWTLFQTWTSSKSGKLSQVAVNIAAADQTTPLTITVFKFSNRNALVQPGYKWTELGSGTFNSSQLSYVFDTAVVSLSSNVAKGDNLGIAVSGSNFTPYCHLEFNDSDPSRQLFQQGSGQNSWRGLQGKTSVVYPRSGKGLKFLAVVT